MNGSSQSLCSALLLGNAINVFQANTFFIMKIKGECTGDIKTESFSASLLWVSTALIGNPTVYSVLSLNRVPASLNTIVNSQISTLQNDFVAKLVKACDC